MTLQQLSHLRLFAALLLLWLAAFRSTKSQAVQVKAKATAIAPTMPAGADAFKFNGNANSLVAVAGGEASVGAAAGAATNTARTVTSVTNNCFEIYSQQSRAANNAYASAYRLCRDLGKAHQMNVVAQQQSVRQDITLAMEDICRASYKCALAESDLEFFQCNSKNSVKNGNTILQVYLNSTAAIVQLESEIGEIEKENLLCIIAAQEQHISAISSAYSQLSQCLKAV